MRRPASRMFAACSMLVMSVFGFACGDSSEPSSERTNPLEGGTAETTPPSPPPPIDSGIADAAEAEVTPGAGPGVSVAVVDTLGAAVPNVRVIFGDVTGMVIGQTATDALGVAHVAPAPSMVTVLSASPGGKGPVTFMGVMPGDVLRVLQPAGAAADDPFLGTFSATFAPDQALVASANRAHIFVGCREFIAQFQTYPPPYDLHMNMSCARPQNALLAILETSAGVPLGFGFAKNLATPPVNTSVTVGPLTFGVPGSRTLTATNVPVLAGFQTYAKAYASVGSDRFALHGSGRVADATGMTFETPTGFADSYESAVATSSFSADPHFQTGIRRREPASAASAGSLTTTDFGAWIPFINSVSATSSARPDVGISTAATTLANATWVQLTWFNGPTGNGTWTFLVPGHATSFKAPALPPDAQTFVPSGTLKVNAAEYVGGSLAPSFAAVKALTVPTYRPPVVFDPSIALPANGTLLHASYF